MTPLDKLLKEARRKIQRERLLRGAAVTLGYALIAFLLTIYFLASNNFSEGTVFWCRIWFGGGLLLVAWRFLLRPLYRRPSPIQIARFLRSAIPVWSNDFRPPSRSPDPTREFIPISAR